MREKLFIGYVKEKGNTYYRVADALTFKTYDWDFKTLRQNIRSFKNCFITREGEFITTDGLIYGVKSDIKAECMNTYTIIGKTAGYYVIMDFDGSEIVALTPREMHMNKDKFFNRPFTNACISTSIDSQMMNIDCLSNGFIDVLTLGACSMDREECKDIFRALKFICEIRENTIDSEKWRTYKTNGYTKRVLESNKLEIDKVLEEKYINLREMLERYSKITKFSKTDRRNPSKVARMGVLDNIHMNTGLYDEEELEERKA